MPSTVPENISFMVNLDPNNDASQTKIVMKSNQDFSRLYKTVSKVRRFSSVSCRRSPICSQSRSTPFWFSVEDHELLIDATPEQLGLQDGAHIAIVDVKPTAVMRRRAAKADQSEAPCSDDTIILNVALRNDTIPLKALRRSLTTTPSASDPYVLPGSPDGFVWQHCRETGADPRYCWNYRFHVRRRKG